MNSARDLFAYLQTLMTRHTRYFGAKPERLLTFVGTTSRPGSTADLCARPIVSVQSDGADGVDVVIQGQLPRELQMQERLTVSIANLSKFTGFQFKTRELSPAVREHQLFQTEGRQTRIHARFVYTVHESPNTKAFFDRVPMAEITREIKGTRYALVGIGCNVNISPRFAWQVDSDPDAVRLYWGDGYLNKTAANFAKNQSLSVLAVDLGSFDGVLLRGEGRACVAEERTVAYAAVLEGFRSGNWGEPNLFVEATFARWGKA